MKNILKTKLFFFLALAMEGCGDCPPVVDDFPPFLIGENIGEKGGGFKGFFLWKCDAGIKNVCDLTQEEIQAFLTAGDAILRYDCELLGEKPAANTTTRKLGSCGVERVVGRTHVYSFKDYKNDENHSIDALYQLLQKNPQAYRLVLIDCNDCIIDLTQNNIAINPNRVHEADNKDGNTYWNIEFSYENICDEIPCCPEWDFTKFENQKPVIDCCPLILSQLGKARLYLRRDTTYTYIYGYGAILYNSLNAIDTGVPTVSNQIDDDGSFANMTPLIWGNPSNVQQVYVRIPNGIVNGGFAPDWHLELIANVPGCGDDATETHTVTISVDVNDIVLPTAPQSWVITYLDAVCSDAGVL